MNFIDLFAGAGGLSEGFIKAGFSPIAHVEMNKDASDTLRTRTAFHYLKENNRIDEYYDYLKGIPNSKGINDPKIQFHKVVKEKIQPQVSAANIELDSFIISNTSYLEVQWKGDMSIEDFNALNVYFQKENVGSYVERILMVN